MPRKTFYKVLIVPIILIGIVGYWQIKIALPEYTESHLSSFAKFGATTLTSRLSGLIDLGKIFTTKIQFRALVADGKWKEAMASANILTEVGFNHSIDRVFLLNTNGTLMAESSAPDISLVGRDFAYRDYYKGVSDDWQPYVSEAFQRIRSPQYSVFVIAIPIPDPIYKDHPPIGILGLSVHIDRFLDWVNQIQVGERGTMYVVDQKGHVIARANLPPQLSLVDFGGVPVVQKVLLGKSGVELSTDPIDGKEKLAAYEPIAVSGWGIIVEQEAAPFFDMQNKVLTIFTIIFGIIVLYCGFLIYSKNSSS